MRSFIALVLCFFVCGCSSAQVRQEIFGMSAGDVTNAPKKYVINLPGNSAEYFAKIEKRFKLIGAVIHGLDKKNNFILADNFNAEYGSCINTTQVGIIIDQAETGKVHIEVASANYGLAEFVAKEIANNLDKKETAGGRAEHKHGGGKRPSKWR